MPRPAGVLVLAQAFRPARVVVPAGLHAEVVVLVFRRVLGARRGDGDEQRFRFLLARPGPGDPAGQDEQGDVAQQRRPGAPGLAGVGLWLGLPCPGLGCVARCVCRPGAPCRSKPSAIGRLTIPFLR